MNDECLIRLDSISKSFGEVKALQKVNLTLSQGEILGLVGDNAAGKTTLMRILGGIFHPDEGGIFVENKEVKFSSPRDAIAYGIEMIHQDLVLVDNIDVAGNIFIGREPTKTFFGLSIPMLLDKRTMENEASQILRELSIRIDSVRTTVENLSGGQRQSVAIARAVRFRPRVLIMDEPTSSLGVEAVNKTLELIKELRQGGISIILISHRLPDVVAVADRIMVLRRGQNAGVLNGGTTLDQIIKLIVGTDQNSEET